MVYTKILAEPSHRLMLPTQLGRIHPTYQRDFYILPSGKVNSAVWFVLF
jgi:hypothetical protein